jgi:hypothetical protein
MRGTFRAAVLGFMFVPRPVQHSGPDRETSYACVRWPSLRSESSVAQRNISPITATTCTYVALSSGSFRPESWNGIIQTMGLVGMGTVWHATRYSIFQSLDYAQLDSQTRSTSDCVHVHSRACMQCFPTTYPYLFPVFTTKQKELYTCRLSCHNPRAYHATCTRNTFITKQIALQIQIGHMC